MEVRYPAGDGKARQTAPSARWPTKRKSVHPKRRRRQAAGRDEAVAFPAIRPDLRTKGRNETPLDVVPAPQEAMQSSLAVRVHLNLDVARNSGIGFLFYEEKEDRFVAPEVPGWVRGGRRGGLTVERSVDFDRQTSGGRQKAQTKDFLGSRRRPVPALAQVQNLGTVRAWFQSSSSSRCLRSCGSGSRCPLARTWSPSALAAFANLRSFATRAPREEGRGPKG